MTRPAVITDTAAQLVPRASGKIATAMALVAGAKTGWDLYLQLRDWYLAQKGTYRITISENDKLYDVAQEQVLQQIPLANQKSLQASTYWHDEQTLMRLSYKGEEQPIRVGEHNVKVRISAPETTSGSTEPSPAGSSSFYDKIVFDCQTSQAKDAVLAWLEEATANLNKSVPVLRLSSNWGAWDNTYPLHARPLSSVILKEGQLERIVSDIQSFYDETDYYRDRGLPHHRGYLFYGPPGTGKTSVATALASHFKKDVCVLSLNDMKEDATLTRLFASIPANSMLLLEDIDTVAVTHKRESTEEGLQKRVSLGGILNSLDGIATPRGLVTIMTTNKPAVLDDALVRTGRIDFSEEIGFLDNDQLHRLFQLFYGVDAILPTITPNSNIKPCDVIEIMKRNLTDHGKAQIEIDKLIWDVDND